MSISLFLLVFFISFYICYPIFAQCKRKYSQLANLSHWQQIAIFVIAWIVVSIIFQFVTSYIIEIIYRHYILA